MKSFAKDFCRSICSPNIATIFKKIHFEKITFYMYTLQFNTDSTDIDTTKNLLLSILMRVVMI